jgi:hypothetical protein
MPAHEAEWGCEAAASPELDTQVYDSFKRRNNGVIR